MSSGRIELWDAGPAPSASVPQSAVTEVNAIPSGVGTIRLALAGDRAPVILDVVGPIIGAFPPTSGQLDRIAHAIGSHGSERGDTEEDRA